MCQDFLKTYLNSPRKKYTHKNTQARSVVVEASDKCCAFAKQTKGKTRGKCDPIDKNDDGSVGYSHGRETAWRPFRVGMGMETGVGVVPDGGGRQKIVGIEFRNANYSKNRVRVFSVKGVVWKL